MINNIKVAGITYKAGLEEFPQNEDDTVENWGAIEYGIAEITINNVLSPERQSQTLIHELTHAMFAEAGISIENEEDVVNRLSLVLYQVLKDNDFSWIGDQEEIAEVQTKDGIIKI